MQTILLIVQVLVAVGLIAIILMQHGRGADAGAAFGSGASATMFGARGAATFLTKLTAVLAVVFLSNSIVLAYLATQRVGPQSVMERLQTAPVQAPEELPMDELPSLPGSSDIPEIPQD